MTSVSSTAIAAFRPSAGVLLAGRTQLDADGAVRHDRRRPAARQRKSAPRRRSGIAWAPRVPEVPLMDCLSLAEPLFMTSQLVAGVAVGGIYALVAVGLVLIYKTSHVVNFAQGELVLLGAYTGWALTAIGLPFPLALLLTLLVAGAFGMLTERLLLRQLIGRPVIAVMIVTLGLSSILRGVVFLFAGTEVRRFPEGIFPATPVPLGPLQVPQVYAWSLLIAGASVAALTLFFRFSRHGLALRAAADDQQAATSMGIRLSHVFGLSWALSAAVAASAGILLANLRRQLHSGRIWPAGTSGPDPRRTGQLARGYRRRTPDRRAAERCIRRSGPVRRWRPEDRVSVFRADRNFVVQTARAVWSRADRACLAMLLFVESNGGSPTSVLTREQGPSTTSTSASHYVLVPADEAVMDDLLPRHRRAPGLVSGLGAYRLSAHDQLRSITWQRAAGVALVLAALLVVPLLATQDQVYVVNTILIACIGALGLNLLTGFTGQISIGHGAFVGVGAFTSALLVTRAGAPLWLSIPAAGAVTTVIGCLVGLPSVRIKGLYLAVATLAAQMIVEWTLSRPMIAESARCQRPVRRCWATTTRITWCCSPQPRLPRCLRAT